MLRVLFDGESFIRHARGGIPRYLTELIHAFSSDTSLGVDPVTPYRWIASKHLAERLPGFTEVPLPRQLRPPILRRLNAGRLRRLAGVDLVHHALYEKTALDYWSGNYHICTFHDFLLERFPERYGDVSEYLDGKAAYLERCDGVICVSEATRTDLFRFHPKFDKPVFVVPHGVSESFFHPSPVSLPNLPERYLLYVGNRHAHKNVDVLMRAFAELSSRDGDLHLVLVGAYLKPETARLRELGIFDQTVRMRVSDGQLPWIYRNAQAFVFPSLWEGFGLPVVEAMASGCPVIVAEADVLLEVAADAALLFDGSDEQTLAEQIERVLADRELADRLRDSGRRRARDFTWHRTAKLTAEAYSQVVAS